MAAALVSRSSIADLNRRQFAGLLGCIIGWGVAVRVFLLVRWTTWSAELQQFVSLVPVAVGVLAYLRSRPDAAIWEIGAVTVWGVLADQIAGIGWFFVGPAYAGGISIAASVPSGAWQLRLLILLQFLGTTAVFAGLYAAAASRRNRPIGRAITLLLVPVVIVGVYAII